jgi:transposase
MHYVGLDVHAKRSSLCILNGDGKVVKREMVHGPWPAAVERLREVGASAGGPLSVCYEAGCGYGPLHDALSPLAAHVAVAHPGALRLIFKAKKKHDRVDSDKLATLLYLGQVPAVHVPSADVRQWRKLIELRQSLLAGRVREKNRVRAVLRNHAVAVPKRPGLWTKKGAAWLASVRLPQGERLAVDLASEAIASANARLARVEAELAKYAAAHPGVALLMTIPGVGVRTAEAFVAYVDDPSRFARVRQVGSYFGLVPTLDSSAGRDRRGHITREGPGTVRKLLTEAAWQSVWRDPASRALFERVTRGKGDRRKIAAVAVAHRLCRVMAAMLRTGEAYRAARASE